MSGHPVSPTVAPGKARLDLQISFNEEGSESPWGLQESFFTYLFGCVSVAAQGLKSTGLNCPKACRILAPDQGWSPSPLFWKADS